MRNPSIKEGREKGPDSRPLRQFRRSQTMLQSVSLSVLEAAAANPRRKIDRKAIEGLAASIKTDGVLHNLVVSPMKGKGRKERYQIVSGSRRFEALRLL
jgi:ParB family transcriptional regulator, chromosome partitioning protein